MIEPLLTSRSARLPAVDLNTIRFYVYLEVHTSKYKFLVPLRKTVLNKEFKLRIILKSDARKIGKPDCGQQLKSDRKV